MLGVGAKKKTYLDDVFSTYLWAGSGSARAINNGINLSGEGGMVWIKNRSQSTNKHVINDTVRGHSNAIMSDTSDANTTQAGLLDGFNSNGFDVSTDNFVNGSSQDYASWTFRKAPGFFDVVTYTGNGSTQNISHSLGCVPGCIIIKRLDSTDGDKDWFVYHRSIGNSEYLELNNTQAKTTSTVRFNSTDPTASVFSLGDNAQVNSSSGSYVAYLFAGGESTAATARSVDFDGSGDYLTLAADSDLDFGSGNFTIECWFNVTSNSTHQSFIADFSSSNYQVEINTDGKCQFAWGANSTSYWSIVGNKKVAAGTWNHIAVVRNGNVFTQYLNGNFDGSFTSSTSANTNGTTYIGRNSANNRYVTGKISNVRIIKGTAVYTSSFRPPTEPLTNITNTKLLCCNNSSTTGSTVTPGTITANGDPTASTDSPFDDPAAFTFGDSKEGIIKCGSYTTDSNEDATVDLGWEPQWVLVKRTDSSAGGDWLIYDSMRGFTNAQDIEANNDGSKSLSPNLSDAENDNSRLGLTSTGFYADQYGANRSFIYLAIRRSDGYVGKPPSLGTGVFAMDTATNNFPAFDSNFVTDMTLTRIPESSSGWEVGNRLTTGDRKVLYAHNDNSEYTYNTSYYEMDSNVGWGKANSWLSNPNYQSWMWKRHAGFDVVTYKGNGTAGHQIRHSLSKSPEMIWVKDRENTRDWRVFHHGLNGGSNPAQYGIKLNSTDAESQNSSYWNDTAPTSTSFTLGTSNNVNDNDQAYIAMLFASVDGISKCGSWTGTGSTQTITVGFAPRFLIWKRANASEKWYVVDTTRGWTSSGNDQYLQLNSNLAQSGTNLGDISSTGFTVTSGDNWQNNSGDNYIYYCHA